MSNYTVNKNEIDNWGPQWADYTGLIPCINTTGNVEGFPFQRSIRIEYNLGCGIVGLF